MPDTCQKASQFRRLGREWIWRDIGAVYDAADDRGTLIANIHARAGHELCNLVLILAAEGTMKKLSKKHACFLRKRERSSANDILPALRRIKRLGLNSWLQ